MLGFKRRPWAAFLLYSILSVGFAWAGPALTTVQDVLYRADGSLFNGTVDISWMGFTASDSSAITAHSLTVRVVNGFLRVQLVPTGDVSPAQVYTVKYNSGGKIQFTESWTVPASNIPIRIRDVKSSPITAGQVVAPPANSAVQIIDVSGLQSELGLRPTRSLSFATSRAAVVDANGQLASAVGNLSDCLHVDGTSAACTAGGGGTGSGPGFTDFEIPAGPLNGSNLTFTLSNPPSPASSLSLFRNGILMTAAVDFTLSSRTITFLTLSEPQTGDQLIASYRTSIAGGQSIGSLTAAGGALTGSYPSPEIGMGVISDSNISTLAGIQEAKLTLNFPTHNDANDPTTAQKGALAGTAGSPTSGNRFVTDQDSRLVDGRTPLGHGILSSYHSDATPASPVRGDLITAQGPATATWSRLAIGGANRCLVSNGTDVVWNTCLFTGFSAGSIPYVDGAGNFAQNAGSFAWDNANRRLSVGNGSSLTTLFVFDATAGAGSTGLVVRAGTGQTSNPLQQWQDASANVLARVGSDGGITAAAFKVQAGGKSFTVPQVLCSSNGQSTGSLTLALVGSCTIPGNVLQAGDRIELRFEFVHSGTASSFSGEIHWGSSTIFSRIGGATEPLLHGQSDLGIQSGAAWSTQSWGTVAAPLASAGIAADAIAPGLVVSLYGALTSGTTDTVTMRGFTIVRYPAQANP